MPTFSLNDETKYNSYGFRVANAGLSLDRFRANPVMLDDHFNSTAGVIGKWNNIRMEDGRLNADPEFDEQDDTAQKIKGKVDRGYLKGASLGLIFDPDKMAVEANGKLALTAGEVLEASIVAVPANAGAIRLYAKETHELMTDEQVKMCLSAFNIKDFSNHNKNQKMEKLMLLTAAAFAILGLETDASGESISKAVESLNAKYLAEKTGRETLQAAFDKQKKDQAKALVDTALADGKLTADVKEQFVQMAETNYELAAKVIGAMPGKKSLAAQVANSSPKEVKTLDEFVKLPLEKQLAFKNEHPDEYQSLLEA